MLFLKHFNSRVLTGKILSLKCFTLTIIRPTHYNVRVFGPLFSTVDRQGAVSLVNVYQFDINRPR